ncbi:stage III sporulation protein AG [Anoxybacter fermentans]|uniref:Stage III sporulation protein AG n=1 Tax=Anoxybacter fermentans TaxID=1323375 RepID=A0A3Q9HQL4_9FIRM|nr:stage III sporulation protein AG [Anoxybacter fermentans]AZR73545.1 stage III sporulation protein AG [Anoxybacter fermentans]
MLQKLWDFLFNPNEKNGKNKRQNALMYISLLAMAGILLMLVSNMMKPSQSFLPVSGNQKKEIVQVFSDEINSNSYEERLEERLKKVLSLIEGVGKVEVDITIEQGPEYIYGFNTSISNSETEERDNSGGIRIIKDRSESQDIVIIRDKNGEEKPVVRTEKSPIIKGVLVVAEGASNPKVNAELTRAVNTVLGIPLHKICVLPYKR